MWETLRFYEFASYARQAVDVQALNKHCFFWEIQKEICDRE